MNWKNINKGNWVQESEKREEVHHPRRRSPGQISVSAISCPVAALKKACEWDRRATGAIDERSDFVADGVDDRRGFRRERITIRCRHVSERVSCCLQPKQRRSVLASTGSESTKVLFVCSFPVARRLFHSPAVEDPAIAVKRVGESSLLPGSILGFVTTVFFESINQISRILLVAVNL